MAGSPRRTGRPSKYNIEIARAICERMAAGEALYDVCKDERFPVPSTVRGWALDDTDGFHAMYARARGLQAEHKFEQMCQVAMDGSQDWITNKDGDQVVNKEHINRSRLIVDTLKWQASKLLPRVYGDKSAVELTGKDGKDLPSLSPVVIFQLPDNERD